MTTQQLIQKLTSEYSDNRKFTLRYSEDEAVSVYPKSINRLNDDFLFIGREESEKYLFIVSIKGDQAFIEKFDGELVTKNIFESGILVKQCRLNHTNAVRIRELFDFTKPVLIGIQNSFGFGDRLGIANPGHLRSIMGTNIRPVLAQQSIRELKRTNRQPKEVIDAATWAVLQEDFRDGFGADADHIKTPEDIDIMVNAGYTMFTIDPGLYVVNEADSLPIGIILEKIKSIEWPLLQDTPDNFIAKYENTIFPISKDFKIQPSRERVLRATVKYGRVIAHTVKMYRHLTEHYPEYPFEIELSIDETDSITSPFEHFLISQELKRLGIQLVSLAPRFVGDFEKGIDYKGDLHYFKTEYIKHLEIGELLGPYKISFHSGSDKFSVYREIGSIDYGHVHVKTAGTSYLEALKTVAQYDPKLFCEILDFSREQFEIEKKSYHISAHIENVPKSADCTKKKLMRLFEQNNTRQVLHVTFGKVLTCKNRQGKYIFKDRILNCLHKYENSHYENLFTHFRKHIEPFII